MLCNYMYYNYMIKPNSCGKRDLAYDLPDTMSKLWVNNLCYNHKKQYRIIIYILNIKLAIQQLIYRSSAQFLRRAIFVIFEIVHKIANG